MSIPFLASPLLHVDIRARFYVLAPKQGDLLKGVVTKLSANAVSVLVADTFHASISEQHLHDRYTFQGDHYERIEEGEGEEGGGSTISMFDTITF